MICKGEDGGGQKRVVIIERLAAMLALTVAGASLAVVYIQLLFMVSGAINFSATRS